MAISNRRLVAAMASCAVFLTACSGSEPPVATGQASTPGPATSASAKAPSSYPLGTKVTVPVTFEGIAAVEVQAFYANVTSSGQYDTSPDAGTTWAAIDATECAGTAGSSTGANSTDFALLLSNGSTASTAFAEGTLKPSALAALTRSAVRTRRSRLGNATEDGSSSPCRTAPCRPSSSSPVRQPVSPKATAWSSGRFEDLTA